MIKRFPAEFELECRIRMSQDEFDFWFFDQHNVTVDIYTHIGYVEIEGDPEHVSGLEYDGKLYGLVYMDSNDNIYCCDYATTFVIDRQARIDLFYEDKIKVTPVFQ